MAHKYGPHGHLNMSHAADVGLYERHLAKLEEEIRRSDETFIRHYKKKYDHPRLPPVWAVSEIMSFGLLSRWITHMKPADRAQIAKVYQIDQKMLKGFVRHMTYVRNLCAHHSRVWNRHLTVTMQLPHSKPSSLIPNVNPRNERNIYNTLVMLAYLLDIASPGSHWKSDLKSLIASHRIEAKYMGFPNNWDTLPIWTLSLATEVTS